MDTGNFVPTSKTSNIKSLLLEAWRERWSPIDWAIKIKQVLPRGVSGDVYDLSNCILIQALVGPTPNSLFISYLNHCISSQVVSYGAALSSIAKYQEFTKPQCIKSLLGKISALQVRSDLLTSPPIFSDLCICLKQRINCYGNEEECISLCKSLVSLAHWLYCCINHALSKLAESKQNCGNQNANIYGNHHGFSHSSGPNSSSACPQVGVTVAGSGLASSEYGAIIEKACDILAFISSSSFLKALFHVGKLDDQLTYSKLTSKISEVAKFLSTGTSCFPPSLTNAKELVDITLNFLKIVEWNNLDPTNVAIQSLKARQAANTNLNSSLKDSMAQSFNAIIAINAILTPTAEIDICARQIALVINFYGVPLSDACTEFIRSCFIELAEHSGAESKSEEDLRWAAFTFLKVPQFFAKLPIYLAKNYRSNEKRSLSADLEAGLEKLLIYTPLLNLTDARTNCDCLDLLLKELSPSELAPDQRDRILSKRQKDSIKGKDRPLEQGQRASLILRAKPTVGNILKSLDADYSKNLEALLGVLSHMAPATSFELILNAAAANGKLQNFTRKLMKFNEFNRESTGEGGKASMIRASLFDITFLMLCHIAQNFGIDIVTDNLDSNDSFFASWCTLMLSKKGRYNPPDAILVKSDPAKVNNFLYQSNSPKYELQTSLVKWHEMCWNIPAVIKETLNAWEAEAISAENVKVILDNIKSKMYCLPVVASAWLCSYISVLPHEERVKPMNMIQQLMAQANSPLENSANSDSHNPGNQDQSSMYKERSILMANIIEKMVSDLYPAQGKGIPSIVFKDDITTGKLLEETFMTVHSRSWLDQRDIHALDILLSMGGPNWFVDSILRLLFRFEYVTDLNRAVGLIYGLFQLDIENCTLCLLVNVLPSYLLKSNMHEDLVEPKATALARLTVMAIFSAMNEIEVRKSSNKPLRRYEFHSELPLDFCVNSESKSNGSTNMEPKPAKMMRLNGSQSFSFLSDDTPFMLAQGNQASLSEAASSIEPLEKAIADLLNLFATIVTDSDISQRTFFPRAFFEQLILCGQQEAHKVLIYLPFQCITGLIKIMPSTISYELMLALSILQTAKARKIIARALCQLRRAKTDTPEFQ